MEMGDVNEKCLCFWQRINSIGNLMCARCGESLKKIGRVSKTEHQNKLTILLFNVWNHEKSINCLWYAEQKVFNFSLCLCVAAFSLSRCLNFQLDNFGCCWNGTFNHQIDFSWTKPDKFSSTHPLSLSLSSILAKEKFSWLLFLNNPSGWNRMYYSFSLWLRFLGKTRTHVYTDTHSPAFER